MFRDEHMSEVSSNYLSATYNLKAVVQETGLKPDTLRAWERRYGLPDPDRTSGGHRLYSERDIDILKWLLARQEEGLSISRAVALWRNMIEQGDEPLDSMPLDSADNTPTPAVLIVGETLNQMRDAWIEACMGFDELSAESILSQALALYPAETVCFDILQAGLSTIGMQWYEGTTTAQQEHFASALAMRRLSAIMAMSPVPTREGRILIGCPPGEEHTFPPLLLTMLMRRRGWDAIYLGANIPLARLEATLKQSHAQLVALTAQTLPTAATLLELAELLEEHDVPLMYGGLVFNLIPDLQKRIPGHFIGRDLRNAPKELERMLNTPRAGMAPTKIQNPSALYEIALVQYVTRLSHIEATVWEQFLLGPGDSTFLKQANDDLSKYIIAALTLGDLNYVATTLDWVLGLLINYDHPVPEQALSAYLTTYYHAVKTQMDEHGKPLIDWFEQLLGISQNNSQNGHS